MVVKLNQERVTLTHSPPWSSDCTETKREVPSTTVFHQQPVDSQNDFVWMVNCVGEIALQCYCI